MKILYFSKRKIEEISRLRRHGSHASLVGRKQLRGCASNTCLLQIIPPMMKVDHREFVTSEISVDGHNSKLQREYSWWV